MPNDPNDPHGWNRQATEMAANNRAAQRADEQLRVGWASEQAYRAAQEKDAGPSAPGPGVPPALKGAVIYIVGSLFIIFVLMLFRLFRRLPLKA